MTDQAPEAAADKSRPRTAPDTLGDNASSLKTEARSFTDEARKDAATGARMADEAAGMVQDLSTSAAQATRAGSHRGREAAFEVGETWRDITESLLTMQLEMNRWVEDVWRRTTSHGLAPSLRPAEPFAALGGAPWGAAWAGPMFGLPAIDLMAVDGAYRLTVELPGLSREDVDVEVRGDVLVISGHKAEEKTDAAAYRVSERRYGRFERRTPIPADVDQAGIQAELRNGLLTVTLPRRGHARTAGQKVAIKG